MGFLTVAVDEHKQFINLLHEKDVDKADPQACPDRVFTRMELVHPWKLCEKESRTLSQIYGKPPVT